jgi:hypothetical protein
LREGQFGVAIVVGDMMMGEEGDLGTELWGLRLWLEDETLDVMKALKEEEEDDEAADEEGEEERRPPGSVVSLEEEDAPI